MSKEKDRRARENADLIKRMNNNENLTAVPAGATHWPPRAIQKKDQAEIRRVMGVESDELFCRKCGCTDFRTIQDSVKDFSICDKCGLIP